jgi:UDP-N-acetylmuramoyl-tripeptide--D-alanyl-D-alanine ligase
MHLNQQFVCATLPDAVWHGPDLSPGVRLSIDTRTLLPGDLFVALVGEHNDGHDFIAQAAEKGACGFIMSHTKKDRLTQFSSEKLQKLSCIFVDEPARALIALARAWRRLFTIPVVGITGSIGKTSTKETVAAILTHAGMPHIATVGNYNTLVGISLALLSLTSNHQAAVIEMGISAHAEMQALADLVRPTCAVITSVGHQHMDGLGGLAGIAAEKRKIFSYFEDDSIGIINGDQSILAAVSYKHPIIKFGLKTSNHIQARKVRVLGDQTRFVLKLYNHRAEVTLQSGHYGRLNAALAAAAVAHVLGVEPAVTVQVLEKRLIVKGRFEEFVMHNGGGKLIHDSYNANPESMKAALLAFEQLPQQGMAKIAILGDMLGLGDNSEFWHRQLGRFLSKTTSIDEVILVGSHVQAALKTLPVHQKATLVPSWKEAVEVVEQRLSDKPAHVLVKASRPLQLGRAVAALAHISLDNVTL